MLRTVVAWVLGTLNTVLWGSVSLAGSLVDRSGRWAHRCMVLWSRINLVLMGTRVETEGLEHIDVQRSQVLASNHQSMADILVLAARLPVPFRFVAKSELFAVPFLGWHMRRAGFIAIERDQPRRAARALLEASAQVRAGMNAVIFPEGTRSPDGTLLPFHGGGFLLAIRSGAPVVPMVLDGTRDIVSKRAWKIRKATARLQVLPAIDSRPYETHRDALVDEVRKCIEARLNAGRLS